jgi:hypothetical protein
VVLVDVVVLVAAVVVDLGAVVLVVLDVVEVGAVVSVGAELADMEHAPTRPLARKASATGLRHRVLTSRKSRSTGVGIGGIPRRVARRACRQSSSGWAASSSR